jgi:hypothetical protein
MAWPLIEHALDECNDTHVGEKVIGKDSLPLINV